VDALKKIGRPIGQSVQCPYDGRGTTLRGVVQVAKEFARPTLPDQVLDISVKLGAMPTRANDH
jgi:hypothetical protein